MKTALGIGLGMTACIAATGCKATGTGGEARTSVVTGEQQAAATPAEILRELKNGNKRFAAGDSTQQDYLAQVEATAGGQFPKAVVLSCLDSRVIPEAAFDMGIGDIFVGRVAGNFENVDMLGSFEFATAAAGSKVIVVLGHSACGAVKGAADNVELGNLTATLANIAPAIEAAQARVDGPYNSSNTAYIDAIVEENVKQTVADITANSDVLAGRVESGQLLVVGGVYDLSTGKVSWMN